MTFYQFARGIVLSVFRVVFRVRVVGKERVPTKGAYILAPSHRSILDVPVRRLRDAAHGAVPGQGRPVHQSRRSGALFDALGAVEVERGTADRGAMRALEARAASGASRSPSSPRAPATPGPRSPSCSPGAAFLA